MNRYLVALIAGVVFLVVFPAQLSSIKVGVEQSVLNLDLFKQVKQQAKLITVKVLAEEFLGSGILIQKQDSTYTVLTNDHVIQAGKPPYTIETFDGKIHKVVETMPGTFFQGNDIAVLRFTSLNDYAIAKLGIKPATEIGEEQVFAAGFPFSENSSQRESLLINKGWVKQVLDKPLERGYQVGYTNNIKKGMSGGALLNQAGEVISINGIHAYPLWESSYFFQDGTKLSQRQQDSIGDYSWGIPIETFIKLASPVSEIGKP